MNDSVPKISDHRVRGASKPRGLLSACLDARIHRGTRLSEGSLDVSHFSCPPAKLPRCWDSFRHRVLLRLSRFAPRFVPDMEIDRIRDAIAAIDRLVASGAPSSAFIPYLKVLAQGHGKVVAPVFGAGTRLYRATRYHTA